MRALKYILVGFVLMCSAATGLAQQHSKLTMANGNLVLTIDLHNDRWLIDSLLHSAGITNTTAEMLVQGDYSALEKSAWKVERKNNVIRIFMNMSKISKTVFTPYLLSSNMKLSSRPGYPSEVLYGINHFSRISVHELPDGTTRFFVPGNQKARRVLLSGSFNNWSTVKGLMNKTDSGWVYDVKLEPGKYAYKFIINGGWTTDVNNRIIENDGTGNDNSIYYRYNYTFRLAGHQSARDAFVAGSFNNWRTDEIVMQKNRGVWEAGLYLHEGVHLYRFFVDQQWLPDPANKATQLEKGQVTSILNLGEPIMFRLNGYQNAKHVYVAGNFNNWNTTMLPMDKTPNGWTLPYTLPAGNYEYRFYVDGQWIADPLNPHHCDHDGHTNSFVALEPNHTFVLKGYGNAKTIRLAGNFNNWNPDGFTLAHVGDQWVISMRLKPGKYLYKFLVDGNWMIDPGNKLWEQNEYNTGNSVLWIE